eukprot:gene6284-26546_t
MCKTRELLEPERLGLQFVGLLGLGQLGMSGSAALAIMSTAVIILCTVSAMLIGEAYDSVAFNREAVQFSPQQRHAWDAAVATTIVVPIAMEALGYVIDDRIWTVIFGADAVEASKITTSENYRKKGSFILFPKNAHSSVFHIAVRSNASSLLDIAGTSWMLYLTTTAELPASMSGYEPRVHDVWFLDHVMMELHGFTLGLTYLVTANPNLDSMAVHLSVIVLVLRYYTLTIPAKNGVVFGFERACTLWAMHAAKGVGHMMIYILGTAMESYGITFKITDPALSFTWGTAIFHALVATSFAVLFEWGQSLPEPA